MIAVTRNAPAAMAVASQPAEDVPHRLPVSSRIAAPASGSSGTSPASLIVGSPASRGSPFERSRVVHVHASPLSVERHDDRQADDHLRGGDDHREEGEHLPRQVAVLTREGDEREVRRIQLELDRHEDDQRVLPGEDPDRADREEHGRDQQEEGDRCPHVVTASAGSSSSGGSSGAGASIVASSPNLLRPCNIAPIAATINRMDVISNGRKYWLKSTPASARTLPPRFTAAKSGR